MVHNLNMGALQAVVHDAASTHRVEAAHSRPDRTPGPLEVEIVNNPTARPPWVVAAEVEGGSAPHLGSPEIIKIAEYATSQGFRILRFQLVDRRHDLVPQPEQDQWSDQLVDAFYERGKYGLQLSMRRDFPNVFMNGVELYLHPGVRIEIRRRGVLLTNDEPRLRTFITSAWKALRLS